MGQRRVGLSHAVRYHLRHRYRNDGGARRRQRPLPRSLSHTRGKGGARGTTYNRNRPHSRRRMDGRTPYQVFKKGILKTRSPKQSTKKEVKTAA